MSENYHGRCANCPSRLPWVLRVQPYQVLPSKMERKVKRRAKSGKHRIKRKGANADRI